MTASLLGSVLYVARKVFIVQVGESRTRTKRWYRVLLSHPSHGIEDITRDFAEALDIDYDTQRNAIESTAHYHDIGNKGAQMSDAGDLQRLIVNQLGVDGIRVQVV